MGGGGAGPMERVVAFWPCEEGAGAGAGGACRLLRAAVKGVPCLGGGGRVLVVVGGAGTAPGWGGGGEAFCEGWVVWVGGGRGAAAKGVAPGMAGAAGCAAG